MSVQPPPFSSPSLLVEQDRVRRLFETSPTSSGSLSRLLPFLAPQTLTLEPTTPTQHTPLEMLYTLFKSPKILRLFHQFFAISNTTDLDTICQGIFQRTQEILDQIPPNHLVSFGFDITEIIDHPPTFYRLLRTSQALSRIAISHALGGLGLNSHEKFATQEKNALAILNNPRLTKQKDFIDLSHLKLTTLAPEIGNCTSLKTLLISGNYLATLPPEIGKLSELQKLSANSNCIRLLPTKMKKLSQLKRLYLYNNPIQTPPDWIQHLPSLKVIGTDYTSS